MIDVVITLLYSVRSADGRPLKRYARWSAIAVCVIAAGAATRLDVESIRCFQCVGQCDGDNSRNNSTSVCYVVSLTPNSCRKH